MRQLRRPSIAWLPSSEEDGTERSKQKEKKQRPSLCVFILFTRYVLLEMRDEKRDQWLPAPLRCLSLLHILHTLSVDRRRRRWHGACASFLDPTCFLTIMSYISFAHTDTNNTIPYYTITYSCHYDDDSSTNDCSPSGLHERCFSLHDTSPYCYY